jgi:uncharacterized membrane protein (Fun14 family)
MTSFCEGRLILVGILPTKERGDRTIMTLDLVSVFGPTAALFFGAGGVGFVVGYAVKKVAKIIAVIVGLFFVGLAYLDYNGWAKIDWMKISNATSSAAQNGVNEISLSPTVGAMGLMGGLIYGLQNG